MKPPCVASVVMGMSPLIAMLVLVAPDRTYPFQMVEVGSTSPLKDAGAIVVRTSQEYQRYLIRRGDHGRRKPKIDWKANQLLAIHLGSVPSAGYSVELKRLVRKASGVVTAEVALVRPPANAITASVISYPYIVVRTPRFLGSVDVRLVTP